MNIEKKNYKVLNIQYVQTMILISITHLYELFCLFDLAIANTTCFQSSKLVDLYYIGIQLQYRRHIGIQTEPLVRVFSALIHKGILRYYPS